MQPHQQAATMATWDLASRFAKGHRASRKRCGSSSQRDGGQQRLRPQAHQGLGTHERGMVQTTRFVAITEKHLAVEAEPRGGCAAFRFRLPDRSRPRTAPESAGRPTTDAR